jgi:hypothetical protein
MSGPDRRHAVGVARDTIALLGPARAGREIVAAALLHDVGKVESDIGTWGRVGVTMAAVAAGRSRVIAWSEAAVGAGGVEAGGATDRGRSSARARVGLYLSHDRIGADLLHAVGSAPLTVLWAGEHHLAPQRWSIDATVGAALKAADGD